MIPELRTFELTLSFTEQSHASASSGHTKRLPSQPRQTDVQTKEPLKILVKDWLIEQGFPHFVESFMEEVPPHTDAAGDSSSPDWDALIESFDSSSPILIYEHTREPLERLAHNLLEVFPQGITWEIRELNTEAWQQAWNDSESSFATERFLIVKDASELPERLSTRIPLIIKTKEAFGTGQHATTLATLEALEALSVKAPADFLDVGTGSGVLAIAASKLGYHYIVGTDIDAAILAEARRNCDANQAKVQLRQDDNLRDDEHVYDVITANIPAPVLLGLLPHIAPRLAPDGHLILAGFIDKESKGLLAKLKPLGIHLAAQRQVRGWVALTLVRKALDHL